MHLHSAARCDWAATFVLPPGTVLVRFEGRATGHAGGVSGGTPIPAYKENMDIGGRTVRAVYDSGRAVLDPDRRMHHGGWSEVRLPPGWSFADDYGPPVPIDPRGPRPRRGYAAGVDPADLHALAAAAIADPAARPVLADALEDAGRPDMAEALRGGDALAAWYDGTLVGVGPLRAWIDGTFDPADWWEAEAKHDRLLALLRGEWH